MPFLNVKYYHCVNYARHVYNGYFRFWYGQYCVEYLNECVSVSWDIPHAIVSIKIESIYWSVYWLSYYCSFSHFDVLLVSGLLVLCHTIVPLHNVDAWCHFYSKFEEDPVTSQSLPMFWWIFFKSCHVQEIENYLSTRSKQKLITDIHLFNNITM